ncbi:hypothetical protein QQ045_017005 [Rhodiola kirilowii]
MNTLLGTSSQSLARLFLNEPLDHAASTSSQPHHDSDSLSQKKMISSSRSTNGASGVSVSMMMSSLSYRMDRARKRQLFLQTYTLESADKSRAAKRVKRVFSKVKLLVVSAVTCTRIGWLGFESHHQQPAGVYGRRLYVNDPYRCEGLGCAACRPITDVRSRPISGNDKFHKQRKLQNSKELTGTQAISPTGSAIQANSCRNTSPRVPLNATIVATMETKSDRSPILSRLGNA